MSSVIVYSSSSAAASHLSPLTRLITDALSIFAAYSVNFIACDLMYHDFNLQQSLKGSYWFILGPVLYIFGPGLAWVEAWVKSIIQKEKSKLQGEIDKIKSALNPFDFIVVPSLFSDKAIQSQQENIDYLRSINRIDV